MLSKNPNITREIIKNNPDKPWDYYWLSQNPNITWDIVQNNPNKSWDYSLFSKNPNITWEIVQKIQINLGIITNYQEILILLGYSSKQSR